MSGRIGVITAAPEARRAKNGDTNVLMLTVRFSDGGTASVQWMPGAGDDTAPRVNDIITAEYYGGVLVATAAKSPGDPKVKTGERNLYSRDAAGNKTAELFLEADGTASLLSLSATGDPAASLALKKTGEAELSSRIPTGTKAARLVQKQSGKTYLGNALAGQDLYTFTNTLLTALSSFSAAAAASQTDPALVSAATALQAALQPLSAMLSQILEGTA
jgi:hypothetical protein